jgi:hypothetical protein
MDCDPTTTSSKPFLWEEEVQFELMPFFFFSKQAQLKKKHKKKKKIKKKKTQIRVGQPNKSLSTTNTVLETKIAM